MDMEETLREKQAFLKRQFGRAKHVQIKDHPVDNSVLEAVFSRGDRRLSGVLRAAWAGGARFDSWRDHFRFPLWIEAFEKTGVDPQDYLGALDPDAVLPWDHIDTGIHRDFLRAELSRALNAEPSLSCLETSCGRCRGCDFPTDLDREFKAEIAAGVRTEEPVRDRRKDAAHRYQIFYAKRGPARYVSHNDLVNIIQRTFRRAGVSVLFSEGFHPKMQMSLVPALPLGMTGDSESLEFKSYKVSDEPGFTEALNHHAPAGLIFLGLRQIDANAPSLTERMSSMVYSFDLDAPEMRAALSARETESGLTIDAIAARLIEEYRPFKPDLLREIFVDLPGRKVVFEIDFTPRKSLRPQDVVERIFGLPRSVHLLTREKINFR
jgi:radical SAM-linked protein